MPLRNVSAAYLTQAADLAGNPGQQAAYDSTGNCVVLAGPGSGKTKTLVLKLARIMAEDVRAPRGAACITYSQECARELTRRLERLGLREALGGPGLVVAALALILLGHPLSGLSSAPELLPTPWGAIGQLLPPGATGSLLRDVVFFNGNGIAHPLIVLGCWLLGGLVLYGLGLRRERRKHVSDVDVVEFGYRETVDA